MSKVELVKYIANETGASQQQTNAFIKAFTDGVQNIVSQDGTVTIVGFGTFHRTHRKATTGRNPQTGEAIQIKASNQPKFSAGKVLKEAVN